MYYKGLYLPGFSRESKSEGVFDSPVTITVQNFCLYLIKINYMYTYIWREIGREGWMERDRETETNLF